MSVVLAKEPYSDPVKTEKINGIIYNMGAGTSKHAEAVSNMLATLIFFFSGKHCKPYTSELDIYLDEENNYRPDISVICDFTKMLEDGYHGAPILVVEVLSPSTSSHDRIDKFYNYEKYGVMEYLLINPEYMTIEQYVLIDERLKLQAIFYNYGGTQFSSYAFEGLVFNLGTVFEYRRES